VAYITGLTALPPAELTGKLSPFYLPALFLLSCLADSHLHRLKFSFALFKMSARLFYDNDCPLEPLKGKTVVFIGYGNQGRAQALNLVSL